MNDFTRGYMRRYKDEQKEALAQPAVAEQHKQEPVAWEISGKLTALREVQAFVDKQVREVEDSLRNIVYTAPYVATPRPQRKPLPRKVIDRDFYGRVDFVRQVEAAHGIKEKNNGSR